MFALQHNSSLTRLKCISKHTDLKFRNFKITLTNDVAIARSSPCHSALLLALNFQTRARSLVWKFEATLLFAETQRTHDLDWFLVCPHKKSD